MIKVQTTLVAGPRFEPTPRFSGKDDYGGFAPPLLLLRREDMFILSVLWLS
jgi:hypothetical protein